MKIGIDIGGSHIGVGVIQENGNLVEKKEKRFMQKDRENIEQSLESYIKEGVGEFCNIYEVEKIGISMPGWAENGVVKSSGTLGIKNYPLVEKLQEGIKLPITIRNDAKCAALAEYTYGCLKDSQTSLFLTLGTGIGGALFLNGNLIEGKKRPGYEFGHMVIEKNGIPCHCGQKGCFERYASIKVLKDQLREALNLDKTTGGEVLLEQLRQNDFKQLKEEKIARIIEEYIQNLSIGIANLMNLFEAEKIGIGGSFVYFADILLPKLRENMKQKNARREGRGDIPIEVATLGNDAGMIGSVL